MKKINNIEALIWDLASAIAFNDNIDKKSAQDFAWIICKITDGEYEKTNDINSILSASGRE